MSHNLARCLFKLEPTFLLLYVYMRITYMYIFLLNCMQYDFSGRNDVISFIKQVQQQGLYVSLRIGPFIEAEWTYGYA